MRIICDMMGGDKPLIETVRGAYNASVLCPGQYILVGDSQRIKDAAASDGIDISGCSIVHTDSVITMEDDPIGAVRAKKNSSMCAGLKMLTAGEGDVFISCGNTGALFTGAQLFVKKVNGISRAAIGTLLPFPRPVLLLDCGANVECTDEYLEQFAVMGSAYMKKVQGVANARVGLLNNGTEDHKGTHIVQDAYKRLSVCRAVNYVGNVEANSLPDCICDVVVCDGFTGNILIKAYEGLSRYLLGGLSRTVTASVTDGGELDRIKASLKAFAKSFDSSEYGGSPFLGISKPVIKAHGSSDARAFCNAIIKGVQYAQTDVIIDIAKEAERFAGIKR